MNTKNKHHHYFHFSLGMTVFMLLFFVIFVSLGIWQLHRYYFKRDLLSDYQTRAHTNPMDIRQLRHYRNKNFLPIWVKGKYLNDKVMFLENRFYQGKVGYEVITPFQVAGSAKILLVNRGWVPANQHQKQLPQVRSVEDEQTIQGYVKFWDEYQFILGKAILNPGHWPLLLQKIEIKKLSQLTQWNLYPFVMRLGVNQKNGFVRNWKPTKMLPVRHLGYAIQWFAMAIVLMIAYFCFSIRKLNNNRGK